MCHQHFSHKVERPMHYHRATNTSVTSERYLHHHSASNNPPYSNHDLNNSVFLRYFFYRKTFTSHTLHYFLLWLHNHSFLQRQTLRAVPVAEVVYGWKDQNLRFWVYGSNPRQVFAPDYPQQCCCGCTILWAWELKILRAQRLSNAAYITSNFAIYVGGRLTSILSEEF